MSKMFSVVRRFSLTKVRRNIKNLKLKRASSSIGDD